MQVILVDNLAAYPLVHTSHRSTGAAPEVSWEHSKQLVSQAKWKIHNWKFSYLARGQFLANIVGRLCILILIPVQVVPLSL